MFVRDHIPLEQGLRLRSGASTATIRRVRDHIPLEQDHIPLEQGLRLKNCQDVRTATEMSETIFH